ncbi:hypothetical protein [Lysinibacillus fusiformis]|uniref:hypothetical protein n=1 Tax=Lysinibacillus TaxID=400634 RepID=UPI0019686F8B|nr:hypothetical protein [Lysinibacillus fusiformis]QSB11973.1 hypothetical protein JTI58_10385 [Lysinibacillus fusiformis]
MKKLLTLLFIMTFFLLLAGCNSEEDYQSAVTMIKQDRWQEAKQTLDELPDDFKDVMILSNYINAKINSEDSEGDYTSTLKLLEKIKAKNYNGEFKNDIEKLHKIVLEKQEDYEQELKKNQFRESISLLSIREYDEALDIVNKIDDENIDTIRNYIYARIFYNKYKNSKAFADLSQYYDYLIEISPTYNGTFAKEINDFVQRRVGLVGTDAWEYLKKEAVKTKALAISENNYKATIKSNPKIGMTMEEVNNSKWGKPKNINKTTTAYGITEQWVYYGNRYIYFENGIVVVIQE